MRGRFAPSPTGELHLGNLRTALAAWMRARGAGSGFVLRFEDLDQGPVRAEYYDTQRRDLEALGIDWDAELRQHDDRGPYDEAIAALVEAGHTYPCYCTRREILEAAAAPHGERPEGAYAGTCRRLDERARRAFEAAGRTPAIRLRAPACTVEFVDGLHGPVTAEVDDVVLMRRDGVPAYHLAVVVDDARQGVQEVVRGDDLLLSTPRQIHVAGLLGSPVPAHLHVPLVLGPQGRRLAKRDGAVTLSDRIALGESPAGVRALLARTLGIADATPSDGADDLAARFVVGSVPPAPWVFGPDVAPPA